MTAATLLVAIAAAGLGLWAGLASAGRASRAHARRVGAVAARLGGAAGVAHLPEAGAPVAVRSGDDPEELDRASTAVLDRLAVLDEARTLLAGALDRVADAVVIADSTGSVAARNRAALALADERVAGALVGEAIEEALAEALGGRTVDRELSLFGPPPRELFLRARPLRSVAGGSRAITGAVAVVADVSDARRIDSVRRDFVANVSHELRTPIGALALLGETILASGDPAVCARLAERIVREAERMGRIVDDLLDLSAIEGEEAPARDRVRLGEVVAEAAELVTDVAAAAGTPVTVGEVPADLAVRGDRRQLVSAVMNLLDNAVKYSEPGSPVDVSVRECAGEVVVEVSDQGIGIPSRDLERVFERFYRVDRARSRESGGTGLGLSIVRHVARSHGGDVTVESREGEGSTFRLVLPAPEDRPEGS